MGQKWSIIRSGPDSLAPFERVHRLGHAEKSPQIQSSRYRQESEKLKYVLTSF